MTCPNCGQVFEGDRCPHCGRPVKSGGGRIAAVILAVFFVVPAALFGACSAFLALDSAGGSSRNAQSWVDPFAIMAAVGIAIALGGIALVIKLWRS